MKKTFTFDRKNGAISEIFLDNNCISSGKTPIFSVQLRCENGVKRVFNAFDAKECIINGEETVYNGFFENLSVKVTTKEAENEVSWEIEVVNNTAFANSYFKSVVIMKKRNRIVGKINLFFVKINRESTARMNFVVNNVKV